MVQLRRPVVALSLLLLAACGAKDGTTASSTTADSETGPGVTTTGLSMSSSPTTGDEPGTTTAVTSSGPSSDSNTTSTTGIDPTTTTTAGTSTGDPVECQIEQPPPGSCDGAAPKQPAIRFAGQLAPKVGLKGAQGPKVVVDAADDEDFATTGCSFICEPDEPGVDECDIFAQDCGPGEKCNAWANGGNSWNATKCVPVVADPDQIGEPCVAEGGGISGIDSCAKGAMCWDLGDDEKGTCVEVCGCSEANPLCATQNTTCTISNDAVLALCLPVCDPLDVDSCSGGDLCLAAGGASQFFICVLDASGDVGAAGDPCEFQNGCDPGLFCSANSGQFPGCDPASVGCCTPFCDLTGPTCPDGTTCTPWYERGAAPQCFEDVGVCI